MRTHWSFRRLANLFCEAGFPTLKFDYFATGDSEGDSTEGSAEQWKADIRNASYELMHMAGTKDVYVVGIRLGAALAAEVAADDFRFKALVLWDPVVNGKNYVEELKSLHSSLFGPTDGKMDGGDLKEFIGYPFPQNMRTGIERINLLEIQRYTVEKLFLVVSQERKEYSNLRKKLVASKLQFDYKLVPDANQWDNIFFSKRLLVNNILFEIKSLLAGNRR
jgi:pimeloyl-ACP methyl ester carboxylesterase